MKAITILTITAITTASLTYLLIRDGTADVQNKFLESQIGALSSLKPQDKMDKLASSLQSYQQINQKQFQKMQLQQDRLDKILAVLDTRLRAIETAKNEQYTDLNISNSIEQASNEQMANKSSKPKDRKFSEADVGKWMNETLSVGNWDKESTELASNQAQISLEKMPGVYLDDMQCSDRFCRATFGDENGNQPAIAELIGEPPFLNDGFTIHEPDGRIALYFARPGESLEELQSEAREVTFESWEENN